MNNDEKYLLIIGFFYSLVFFVSINFPFFWDTILYSRIAHWFLENNFSGLILPELLDTGNQPFFSLAIAFLWNFFGKSLFISHLLIFPFLIGIGWQYYLLAKNFINKNLILAALLFLFIEPTLLAQSTMVSLDIIIVFFYLLGLNGIIKQKSLLISVAAIGLSLTNLRGDLLLISLLLTNVIVNYHSGNKIFTNFINYIPGLIIIAT